LTYKTKANKITIKDETLIPRNHGCAENKNINSLQEFKKINYELLPPFIMKMTVLETPQKIA